MDKFESYKYEDVKQVLLESGKVYSSEKVNELRVTLSKLQSDIGFFEYQLYLRKKAYFDLEKEFRKLIGVCEDETVKKV